MKIFRTITFLTLIMFSSTSVIATSLLSFDIAEKGGVIMATKLPAPQVWIDVMPSPFNSIKPIPTVKVYMRLENSTSESITYTFPSSQVFDIYITDVFGNVISSWSRGRVFAQEFTDVTILPGSSSTFGGSVELTYKDGQYIKPGKYGLSIVLGSKYASLSPSSKMPLNIDWTY